MIEIKEYRELEYYLEMFRTVKPNLMVIMSKGGTGKTTLAEKNLKEARFIRGHITPLAFFREIAEYSNEEMQLVLDDINLFKSAVMVGQLKMATDTKERQTVGYSSTHHIAEMLPKIVEKKISTLILLNKANMEVNPDLQALGDRGHCLFFNPSSEEIFNYAKENKLVGDEVLGFVKQHFPLSKNFSLRTFKKAEHHYKMGNGWKEMTLKEMAISPRLAEIEGLMRGYKTDEERVQNFSGSRATYYRWKSQSLSV